MIFEAIAVTTLLTLPHWASPQPRQQALGPIPCYLGAQGTVHRGRHRFRCSFRG